MCPDPRLHRAVSFIPCSPTFASLPSLKHRRLLPPCSRTALAASTRNSSQKPRWRRMTGNCWEPAWVPAWEFAAGREGTARGRGRCFGGCLPSPLSVAGLFFTGKKNHQSLETLVQFLPWVSWSYRCFQTSWWFGLQLFGLMVVYLSNRCRTSILELGFFFFFSWVGGMQWESAIPFPVERWQWKASLRHDHEGKSTETLAVIPACSGAARTQGQLCIQPSTKIINVLKVSWEFIVIYFVTQSHTSAVWNLYVIMWHANVNRLGIPVGVLFLDTVMLGGLVI